MVAMLTNYTLVDFELIRTLYNLEMWQKVILSRNRKQKKAGNEGFETRY